MKILNEVAMELKSPDEAYRRKEIEKLSKKSKRGLPLKIDKQTPDHYGHLCI
jgi:hypothetical protein